MRRLALLLILFSTTAHAQAVPDADAWRADLRELVRQLEIRHPDPYHSISPEAFAEAVAGLDAAIPTLETHEAVLGLARLVALVGEGHTGVKWLAPPSTPTPTPSASTSTTRASTSRPSRRPTPRRSGGASRP